MDVRLQILAVLICLYGAKAIPWAAKRTEISLEHFQFAFAGLFVLAAAFLWRPRLSSPPLFGDVKGADILWSVGAGLALFVLSGFAYALSAALYAKAGWPPPKELSYFNAKTLSGIAGVLCFVIAAAVLEEYLFRGVILNLVQQQAGAAAAIMISSLVFSLYHLSLFQALPTFLLGLGLGVLYLRTNVLLSPIIAHATFNLAGAALFLASASRQGAA